MYSNSKAHIKLAGHISNEIHINKGTEQGHPLSPDLFKLFFKDLSPLLNFTNCPSLVNQIVSHLLWADDLVLLALDPVTLQNQLNILDKYCHQWGVEINMTKTKLLIFNGSNYATRNHNDNINNLTINGEALERVYSYCYLGIDITDTGSFKISLKNLKIKATRALINLKRTIDRTVISFKSCCALFDALVKPILLYATQIWFPSLLICRKGLNEKSSWLDNSHKYEKSVELLKKMSSEIYENVHLKFLKWVLGVHPKASNIGVWGETGRHPLTFDCLKLTLNYFYRVKNLNDNSILSLAFEEQKVCKLAWHEHLIAIINNSTPPIDSILCENRPISEVHVQQARPQPQPQPSAFLIHNGFVRDPNRINQINNETKTVLNYNRDKFYQCWNEIKSKSPKLSFYHQCKTIFQQESYLSDINNFNDRASLTRIRISAHDLKIETGRYSNLPQEERICPWCELTMDKRITENEQHFLLNCDLYNTPRRAFLNYINISNPTPLTLSLKSFLTVQNNASHNRTLSKTIHNMIKVREKFILSLETEDNPHSNPLIT